MKGHPFVPALVQLQDNFRMAERTGQIRVPFMPEKRVKAGKCRGGLAICSG
jgi:hypothetical protein